MRRLVGLGAAVLLLTGCTGASICDCGPAEDPVEFTGRLVELDLGDADGADGSDVAVYEVVSWRSGTPEVAKGAEITVTYWETGHLLEVGETYLVGASLLHDGTLYSGIPTVEHCECSLLTRRADGSPVDHGLLERFHHLCPWWAIWLVGPATAVAAALAWRRRGVLRVAAASALAGAAGALVVAALWILRLGREETLGVAVLAIAIAAGCLAALVLRGRPRRHAAATPSAENG